MQVHSNRKGNGRAVAMAVQAPGYVLLPDNNEMSLR
jgi:hypothetical protein